MSEKQEIINQLLEMQKKFIQAIENKFKEAGD